MEEAGFSAIERYALPCDGVTTYDDCTMPLAWDRTGRSTLEIIDPALSDTERMLADTDVEPLNATIWSAPTPPEGVTAELVSLRSVESEDWSELAGKIVLCQRSPGGDLMRKVALSGALGLVSYVEDILDSNPDDVRWMNGVGWCGWYYVKGDKMLQAAKGGFINATDLADYLVRKGLPFRSAYKVVGQTVALCIRKGKVLEELSLEEYKEQCALFESDLYNEISLETCVAKRISRGSTGPESVKLQLSLMEEKIKELKA